VVVGYSAQRFWSIDKLVALVDSISIRAENDEEDGAQLEKKNLKHYLRFSSEVERRNADVCAPKKKLSFSATELASW